jgi:signal-transduction protein with cAMP-binding, CBS, and nucleotidyltransferase domain
LQKSKNSVNNEITAIVEQFMVNQVVRLDGKLPITVACKRLLDNQVGSLLIENGGSYGVFSKTDVLKCIAQLEDPGLVRTRDFATKPIITCFPTDSLEDAMLKMAKNSIKRLFVIDPKTENETVVGVISSSDILRIAPGLMEVLREEAFLRSADHTQENGKEYFDGICDDCKNHSEFLTDLGGFALCKKCVEAREEEEQLLEEEAP